MDKNTIYAIINKDTSIADGVTNTFGNEPFFNELTHYSMYLGEDETLFDVSQKKYDDGKWIEMPKVEAVEEPTEEEIVQAELLLNQLLMQEQLNSIDEVNAQILLNTMGGI